MSEIGEQSCFDYRLLNLIKENDVTTNIVACSIIETKNLANFANKSGDTLLHFAARYRSIGMIKYLIKSGSEVNARNVAGKTPIIVAMEDKLNRFSSYSALAVEILYEAGANIYVTDNDGNCTANLVLGDSQFCEYETVTLFLQIIERECDQNSKKVAQTLLNLNCPLWQAVLLKNAEVIEEMIQCGCPVNSCHPTQKFTALHKAVGLMDLKTVELLIRYGADLNLKNSSGQTALTSYHCFYPKTQIEEPKILKILLNGMVFQDDVTMEKEIWPIMRFGTKESIQILLECKSNAINVIGKSSTLLHYLAQNPNPDDITEVIKECNFNMDIRNIYGFTPLFKATFDCLSSANTFKFLLNNGADVHAKCDNQDPTFVLLFENLVCKKELLKTIVIFLEHGLDVQMIGSFPAIIHHEIHKTNMDTLQQSMLNGTTVFDIIKCKRTFYVAEPMLAHLAMLEELGNTVTDRIRNQINSHPMFENHFDLCKRKLKKMKKTIIHGKLTIFTILVDRREEFAERYRNNQNIISKLENLRKKYCTKYYYDAIIRKRISSAILKIKLFQQSAYILSKLLEINNINHIVVSIIIKYLNYQDMKNLSEVEI